MRRWTHVVAAVFVAWALPAAASAHSNRIVWARFVDADFSAEQIVSARPDGSDLRVLTHPRAGVFDTYPRWSPHHDRVVFERDLPDGSSSVVVVAAHRPGERILDLGCRQPCAADVEPHWTPDGRIAFTRVIGPFDQPNDSARSAVLYTARPDGSDLRRLSEPGIDGAYEDYDARWAPDGSYIVFGRTSNVRGLSAIFRMRPDATDVRRLTPWRLDAEIPDVSQAGSGPSEDLVAFETDGRGGQGQDIGTVPATCPTLAACAAAITLLTHNDPQGPAFTFSPAFSPDGARLAFAEFGGTDYADVFTESLDGSGRRLVSRDELWNHRPDWAGVTPAP